VSLPYDWQRVVEGWAGQDPDVDTRTELTDLLRRAELGESQATAVLADAFRGRLEFGTSGLRGALGPGPNRMNRVVVSQTAAGLAKYLTDSGCAGGKVLIGFDARHKSQRFAADTAEIMAGAGFEALLTAGPLPTPVLAFGVRHYGCVAAVVVTASHNPATDNGYKVYLGDGFQLVPPADTEISKRVVEVARHELSEIPRSNSYAAVGERLLDAYVDRTASLVPPEAPRELSWVYTPLHGVGREVVDRVIARNGFPPPEVVAEQADPDPDFPTVPFPNPEEPGATDLALALASATDADIALANDPDADRCAVAAVIGPSTSSGHPSTSSGHGWRMLTGDELGALLADDALRRGISGTYACSIVSSSLLAAMAARHGQPFASTLTGFKWIGRVPGLVFGYEEAIGYCVDPQAVSDKDGITALLRVLTIVAGLKASGQTVADRLDEIARAYGTFATDQLSFRVDDLEIIRNAMDRLRRDPPRTLAGSPVRMTDLANGTDELPATDGVLFEGAQLKVVARPSGTEPKLKCYLEARVPIPAGADLRAARGSGREVLAMLRTEISTSLGL
jgi:phosphomannomutase